jgi:glycosyltransferase involved in cell wall biosynthesis
MDGRRIKVIGGGPLEQELRKAARGIGSRFEILGQIPHAETVETIRRARVLLFPSVWYEGLPTTILEALACGVPVVASRLGAMSEMLTDGQEGFLVTPGDSTALADRSSWLLSDDDLRTRMSAAARSTFESRYSPDRCYEKLVMIYRLASEAARARRQVT